MNGHEPEGCLQQIGTVIMNGGGEHLLIPEHELRRVDELGKDNCEHCGEPFTPRKGQGGKPQKFCSAKCRMANHSKAAADPPPGSSTAVAPPAVPPAIDPEEPRNAVLLLASQDAIRIYRDENGNLVLEQNCWPDDDQRILINGDYEDRFVDTLTDFLGYGSARP